MTSQSAAEITAVAQQALWYKDAVLYQVHVKAFFDSNNDGMGDFRGLTSKLDYIQDLGVSALWLLPFYPSPLKDDGYDVSDYHDVHPQYGTVADFKQFVREAQRRGLRVITELVVNHTSDQHPWFQAARRAPKGSPKRDYYVWSDTDQKYKGTRIIFTDTETSNWAWDDVAKQYYWHRFFSHQPDLNFDNPHVLKAVFRTMQFWLDMGVDGFRLDAVPYLIEREGTSNENVPETHLVLKEFRKLIDQAYPNKMLLAEANMWPEDVRPYFGEGDECHMAFHFPLMPRMYMAIAQEDRYPVVEIMQQTPDIPDNCQWAMFLRNHDELTLEMVTDEERDYMWRVYANDPHARINLGIRRRLAPLLANNRRKIELLNALLFSMPGTPIIYYGDEIGMGDNIYLGDRNGCRTPMQWSPDRNAGFSQANPQQLHLPVIIDPEYHYEAINVETQQKNLSSMLWWMRRVIAMRKNFKAFSRGSIEFLFPENAKVLAFLRRYEDEIVLGVVNLSRFSQFAELDLSKFAGSVPLEIIGRSHFPPIKKTPYFLTLNGHSSYWFTLVPQSGRKRSERKRVIPGLNSRPELQSLLDDGERGRLEDEILPEYITTCRWFGAKARTLREMRVTERSWISPEPDSGQLWIIQVSYLDGPTENYALPIKIVSGEKARNISQSAPHAVIARFEDGSILFDAVWDNDFREKLFRLMLDRQPASGRNGKLVGALSPRVGQVATVPPSNVLGAEQSNSSILFADKFFLKLYRKLEDGVNPDVEVTRFLTERAGFENVPAFGGAIEYRRDKAPPTVVCLLQDAIQAEGDAWTMTLDHVGRYYERVLGRKAELQNETAPAAPLIEELIGGVYAEKTKLLAQRTGELHLALASVADDPLFAPEPFNAMAQRSVYQSMRALLRRNFDALKKKLKDIPDHLRAEAKDVLGTEKEILAREKRLLDRKTNAAKIRIHGDYHLGQILSTGKDFVILDFEGEPARPMSERKLKRSALRDVAGMMRSFQYAAYSALWQPGMRAEDVPFLERWADIWYRQMGGVFLQNYLETTAGATFVPNNFDDFQILLEAYLLDKAVYEIGYELNNRPDWVVIPIRGIKHILKSA